MPLVTKLVRVVIFCLELPPIKSKDPLVMWSCGVKRLIEYHILICRRPMAFKHGIKLGCEAISMKLGQLKNYPKKLQPLKLHDLTLVTWQIDKIISPLFQFYGHHTPEDADFREKVQNANA